MINGTARSIEVPGEDGRLPVVSVVIPSFNAAKTIRTTLNALRGQVTRVPFEIIVVDSSKDHTGDIIREEYPEVHLIRLDQQTYPGRGRNIGIQHARGEYVAFIDSDCIPRPDWIEQIAATFAAVEADAVGGSIINGYPKHLPAWVNHFIEFNEWTETTRPGYVTNIPSANLIYRRQAFEQYNEYFPDWLGSEDTLLNWRMSKKGAKIYFNPRIQVVHNNDVDLKKLFRHQYTLGRWSARALREEDLAGNFVTRYPLLVYGLPLARWVRAFSRLVQKDFKKSILFLATSPLYFAAAVAWSIGFNSKKPLRTLDRTDLKETRMQFVQDGF